MRVREPSFVEVDYHPIAYKNHISCVHGGCGGGGGSDSVGGAVAGSEGRVVLLLLLILADSVMACRQPLSIMILASFADSLFLCRQLRADAV